MQLNYGNKHTTFNVSTLIPLASIKCKDGNGDNMNVVLEGVAWEFVFEGIKQARGEPQQYVWSVDFILYISHQTFRCSLKSFVSMRNVKRSYQRHKYSDTSPLVKP